MERNEATLRQCARKLAGLDSPRLENYKPLNIK